MKSKDKFERRKEKVLEKLKSYSCAQKRKMKAYDFWLGYRNISHEKLKEIESQIKKTKPEKAKIGRPKLDKELRQKIEKMVEQGFKTRHISKTLGCEFNTVSYIRMLFNKRNKKNENKK